MRKLKIYLSGAINGRENYKEEFEYAKIRIKDFEAKNNKKLIIGGYPIYRYITTRFDIR